MIEIKIKYTKQDFNWTVIGYEEAEKIKAKLNAKKKKKLYINNLTVFNFQPGDWFEYESKSIKDRNILVINDKWKIQAYQIRKYVAKVDQEALHFSVKALCKVKEYFKENTNVSFKVAFGTADDEILRCVPKQLYWSKEGQYIGKINSVDFSSQYPSGLCDILPDSHTAIKVNGTVKPTEEYPFAFYINSGHLAIYKELDTHNWLYNLNLNMEHLFRLCTLRKTFDDRFNFYVKEKDDITILMKASKYNLKDTYTHFYNLRKTDENAKLVLNASIGQMHRKNYTHDRYAHLAAIAIARANQKMLNIIKEIGFNNIIQIQVDGILYKGTKKVGVDTKYLGAPVQEIYNKDCRWDRLGVYMIKLDNEFKIKCQGYNKMSDGRLPIESTSFDDMNLWIKE